MEKTYDGDPKFYRYHENFNVKLLNPPSCTLHLSNLPVQAYTQEII